MPAGAAPASLLADLPTDRDALDFEPYVATLAAQYYRQRGSVQ